MLLTRQLSPFRPSLPIPNVSGASFIVSMVEYKFENDRSAFESDLINAVVTTREVDSDDQQVKSQKTLHRKDKIAARPDVVSVSCFGTVANANPIFFPAITSVHVGDDAVLCLRSQTLDSAGS